MLLPSLYLQAKAERAESTAAVDAKLRESLRVAKKFGGRSPPPVIPYTWYRYPCMYGPRDCRPHALRHRPMNELSLEPRHR